MPCHLENKKGKINTELHLRVIKGEMKYWSEFTGLNWSIVSPLCFESPFV